VREIPVELIAPNPDQPRKIISESELDALSKSVAEKGVVQPILVRPISGPEERYQIVAGERRWRAAQRAQLHEVPAVVRELTDQETLEIGIVENIQRADLNPVEEARAYKQLIERFGHSQEEVAQAVSKSRSHVANMVRLLSLPSDVLDHLAEGRLSAGHARAIATAPDPSALAETIVDQGLSVRNAERLAREAMDRPEPAKAKSASKPAAAAPEKDADTRDFERHIADRLGLEVDIRHDGAGGELRIRYTKLEQLDDLARRLTGGGV
jgi:ParB family chromosome partitioning protein